MIFSQTFYSSAISELRGAIGSVFNSLSSVDSPDLRLINLCDNFGSYMPVWNSTVDGLDIVSTSSQS